MGSGVAACDKMHYFPDYSPLSDYLCTLGLSSLSGTKQALNKYLKKKGRGKEKNWRRKRQKVGYGNINRDFNYLCNGGHGIIIKS